MQQIIKSIEQQILDITVELNTKYPELAKYIVEMPVTIPKETDPLVTHATMQEYYDSLCALKSSYELELNVKKTNQTI